MLYQFLWPTQIAAAITLDFYFLKGTRNSLLPSASLMLLWKSHNLKVLEIFSTR